MNLHPLKVNMLEFAQQYSGGFDPTFKKRNQTKGITNTEQHGRLFCNRSTDLFTIFCKLWGVSIASQFNFAPQGRQEVSASYEN
ncbi:hypothetical protein AWQ21_08550 [Picosynechococcus sp. PCC 7003]|uniref:hypothetical protein n=1 Tax=Picosynechococcus sp. PCC 7003 TaxID=374981 RepID=UPI000810B036|nr:hypothetical protein [Picosynechococcus sp. PCC 7003]ANV84427.1 hypothetical protein AWQ21_08550 [Picosynechococcus sp. PCC 7003]